MSTSIILRPAMMIGAALMLSSCSHAPEPPPPEPVDTSWHFVDDTTHSAVIEALHQTEQAIRIDCYDGSHSDDPRITVTQYPGKIYASTVGSSDYYVIQLGGYDRRLEIDRTEIVPDSVYDDYVYMGISLSALDAAIRDAGTDGVLRYKRVTSLYQAIRYTLANIVDLRPDFVTKRRAPMAQ